MNTINKINLTLLSLIFTTVAWAQNINYQAVIFNTDDEIVSEQEIGIQISIIKESVDGTEVYVETQYPETNINGLINVEIGSGTIVSGDFSNIDWQNGPFFIKTDIDTDGGNNYTITSINQILSVPYALYANKAGNTFSGNYNDLTNKPDFSDWDTNVNDDFDGDYNNLSNTPDFTDWDTNANDDFSGSYNDLTNIPENIDIDASDDFSGDYNDLTNKPDFTGWDTDVNDDFNGDYNNLTNKPDFSDWDTDASDDFNGNSYYDMFIPASLDINYTDDFSGDYNDLINQPDFTGWDTNVANDFDYQYSSLIDTPTNLSYFINDIGYMTEVIESDPVFNASPSSNITSGNITNWNTDFSATNELQILNISRDTVYLSDGGFAVLPKNILNSLDTAYNLDRTIIADQGAVEVNGTDGIVFSGSYGNGTIPASGAGVRTMWYPRKAAFRSGGINSTQWDDDNIGIYSFATGYNNIASNDYTSAMGINSIASGNSSTAIGDSAKATNFSSFSMGTNSSSSGSRSIAMGYECIANRMYAIAMGYQSIASGKSSIAIGDNSSSTGDNSTAMGNTVNADSYGSFAIGRYNMGGGNATGWVNSDPLFEIGNGTSQTDSANALTVYKNGTFEVNSTIKVLTEPTEDSDAATKNYYDNTNTYQIGDFAQGGVVFWVDETGKHGLVCSVEDASSSAILDLSNFKGPRFDGIYAGKLNTDIITLYAGKENPDDPYDDDNIPDAPLATSVCLDYEYTQNGVSYNDWYIPSFMELSIMYQKRSLINSVSTANEGNAFAGDTYLSSTFSHYTNPDGWIYASKAISFFSGNIFNDSFTYLRLIRAF